MRYSKPRSARLAWTALSSMRVARLPEAGGSGRVDASRLQPLRSPRQLPTGPTCRNAPTASPSVGRIKSPFRQRAATRCLRKAALGPYLGGCTRAIATVNRHEDLRTDRMRSGMLTRAQAPQASSRPRSAHVTGEHATAPDAVSKTLSFACLHCSLALVQLTQGLTFMCIVSSVVPCTAAERLNGA